MAEEGARGTVDVLDRGAAEVDDDNAVGDEVEQLGQAGPFGVPGTVRVYATSDLEGYRLATRQLTRLQELLTERPDPASLEVMSEQLSVDLPYLPIPEAGQPLAARVGYIDTPELSGVAYVTGFRQDVFPFARDDFWYTFQGVSADGQWYVSVTWVLRATMFPARVGNAAARRVGRNARTWARYIRQSVNTLDAAEPSAFRPSLETLDALVRSIDFESVAVPGATPSAAPTASPPPPAGVPASVGPVPSQAASAAPSAAPPSAVP